MLSFLAWPAQGEILNLEVHTSLVGGSRLHIGMTVCNRRADVTNYLSPGIHVEYSMSDK